MSPNPRSPKSLIAEFRAAADGSARDVMLVEGTKLQREALAAGLRPHAVAWQGDGDREQRQVVELLRAAGADVHEVSERTLERLSDLQTPQGPCALFARPVRDDLALLGGDAPLVVLACGVKDPGNLGALLRVCEAAGASGLVALTGGADPFRPKAVRAAAGSAFRTPVRGPVAAAAALELVRTHGLVCVAADGGGGTSYLDVDWRRPLALALGGEGPGLPPEVAAAAPVRVHVPMVGAVESLNVAVAAGVLLYEARRQRGSVRGVTEPLAERLRPRTLAEIVGQVHLLGEGRALRAAIEAGHAGSLILFGPPGVGKTTLALLLARASGLHFVPFSAVLAGVKDVREAVAAAEARRRDSGQGTLVFVDEIHRFNKAQQDAFLPHVESGRIVLVGATTENPAFSVVAPLLSRCRAVRLEPLEEAAMTALLERALTDLDRGLGAQRLTLDEVARARLLLLAGGDARRMLNLLEVLAQGAAPGAAITAEQVVEAAQQRTLVHDRAGDLHYDLLSALHKSLRSSDVQAAVYWLARLIEAEGDPIAAARRMVAMAAEDVGLADPMALQVATAALTAAHQLGLPEARLPLTEAAIYLAAAPKSNSVCTAIDGALAAVRGEPQHPVPLRLRNAPTRLAREMGHGRGHRYAHDHEGGVAPMDCLPDAMHGRVFYRAGDRGFEARVRERMAEVEDQRRRNAGGRQA